MEQLIFIGIVKNDSSYWHIIIFLVYSSNKKPAPIVQAPPVPPTVRTRSDSDSSDACGFSTGKLNLNMLREKIDLRGKKVLVRADLNVPRNSVRDQVT